MNFTSFHGEFPWSSWWFSYGFSYVSWFNSIPIKNSHFAWWNPRYTSVTENPDQIARAQAITARDYGCPGLTPGADAKVSIFSGDFHGKWMEFHGGLVWFWWDFMWFYWVLIVFDVWWCYWDLTMSFCRLCWKHGVLTIKYMEGSLINDGWLMIFVGYSLVK